MERTLGTAVCNEADRAEQLIEVAEDSSGIDEYPYTDHRHDDRNISIFTRGLAW